MQAVARLQHRALRAKMRPQPASKAYVKRAISRSEDTKHAPTGANTNQEIAFDLISIVDITSLSEGDAQTNYSGPDAKFMELKFNWRLVAQAATAETVARIIVIQWYENSATPPTVTQLFGSVGLATHVDVVLNDQDKLFGVLYDKRISLAAITATDGANLKVGGVTIRGNRFPRKIMRDNADGVGKNHLFVVALSDVTNASDTGPFLTDRGRLAFKDM